jgi:CubicO group peptidase (beta-lactamase class C family)
MLDSQHLLWRHLAALLFASANAWAGVALAQTASGAAAPAVPAAADIAADPDVRAAQRLFGAWIEGQIAYKGWAGVAVGVVHDQQLVWKAGFGFADTKLRRPMTPATQFRIASHSKVFNAIAIMQLREQGKLRLDDPVAKYLPWFQVKPVGEDDGEITIEHLITHSSGLPREASGHWSSYEFPTREQLMALMKDRQAAFPPATRLKYSNLAVTVAGMVVEEVSGLPWATYVQQNILDPLEMRATSVDQNVPGLATPYGRRLPDGSIEQFGFVDARGMASATGMTSTVEDLAKLVSAQFRSGPRGGKQILSSASMREMFRIRNIEQNWSSGYGLGFGLSRIRDQTWIGHSGGYPGYLTRTIFQLNDKLGVIVLTNSQDASREDIANQLIATVGQAVVKAASKAPQGVWDPAWERFAGLYRSRGSDSQVVVLNRRLVIVDVNAPNLDNPVRLEPLGGGRFRYVTPSGGGPVGETVYFEEVPGKPMRMFIGDGWTTRIETKQPS